MKKIPQTEPTPSRRISGAVVLAGLILAGCAHLGEKTVLGLEHHTVRMPLTVDADGVAHLSVHQPLVGSIDLRPILEAEGIPARPEGNHNLQLLIHFGRFYVTGDGFRSVWVVSPNPGSAIAEFRPIRVVPKGSTDSLRDVRLSRYGSAETTCLRVDRGGAEPVFIDREGRVDTICR